MTVDVMARLDDEHRAVLEVFPESLFDFSDLEATRATLAAFGSRAPNPLPEGVTVQDRLVTADDGHAILVRLYRPIDAPGVVPALYWIHGGGLVLGDVAMNDVYCAETALELGIVVASVEYRLAPEHPYPTPLEDCYAGLRWLVGAAGDLSVDRDRIAVGGASAGGGLAAGLTLLTRDRGQIDLTFQLLVYPMLDDRNITASSHAIVEPRVWNRRANLHAWNAYLDGEAGGDTVSPHAAPARADDLTGLPPAYLPVGEFDLFLDEDVTYARALMAAGVSTELHVHAGAFHGSNSLVPDSATSKRWRAGELGALRRGLGL